MSYSNWGLVGWMVLVGSVVYLLDERKSNKQIIDSLEKIAYHIAEIESKISELESTLNDDLKATVKDIKSTVDDISISLL
jgi:hypothetical protein